MCMKGSGTQPKVKEGQWNVVNGQGRAVECSERSRKGSGKVVTRKDSGKVVTRKGSGKVVTRKVSGKVVTRRAVER